MSLPIEIICEKILGETRERYWKNAIISGRKRMWKVALLIAKYISRKLIDDSAITNYAVFLFKNRMNSAWKKKEKIFSYIREDIGVDWFIIRQ